MLPAARLPSAKAHRYGLADLLPACRAALRGEPGRLGLAPVRTAIVLLADGLGREALDARAGHARHLLGGRDATIDAAFPTTTAAAIPTLTTGSAPGNHGMTGYRALDPAHDRVVCLLTDWDDRLDPATWQRHPTWFERLREDGMRAVAIGPGRYRSTGFTAAALRGADYRAAESIADRIDAVREEVRRPGEALLYVYAPELDVAAHRHGWRSGAWTAALEELDAAVARLLPALGPRDGLLVTGDHGVVDVPASAHVIAEPGLLDGVRHVAGEPRCLQLHLEPGGDVDAVAARWREREGERAWIATRQEAIAAGWFGDVDPAVSPRIGDVIVAARGRSAFYADPADRGREMVGQHGSLTRAEAAVPLLRFGAWA